MTPLTHKYMTERQKRHPYHTNTWLRGKHDTPITQIHDCMYLCDRGVVFASVMYLCARGVVFASQSCICVIGVSCLVNTTPLSHKYMTERQTWHPYHTNTWLRGKHDPYHTNTLYLCVRGVMFASVMYLCDRGRVCLSVMYLCDMGVMFASQTEANMTPLSHKYMTERQTRHP
jgi:hypothetical protein